MPHQSWSCCNLVDDTQTAQTYIHFATHSLNVLLVFDAADGADFTAGCCCIVYGYWDCGWSHDKADHQKHCGACQEKPNLHHLPRQPEHCVNSGECVLFAGKPLQQLWQQQWKQHHEEPEKQLPFVCNLMSSQSVLIKMLVTSCANFIVSSALMSNHMHLPSASQRAHAWYACVDSLPNTCQYAWCWKLCHYRYMRVREQWQRTTTNWVSLI